jgi:YbgC/YbaW family acyl-CoA thioester hydrolase
LIVKPRLFRTVDRVRWGNVDKMGIIYYGTYVRFVELGETELYRELGFSFAEMFDRFDFELPRVHLNFDFLHPALVDDEIAVETTVTHVGASSIHMQLIFRRVADARVLAKGKLVTACVDRVKLRPRRIPEELREALRGCLGSA